MCFSLARIVRLNNAQKVLNKYANDLIIYDIMIIE